MSETDDATETEKKYLGLEPMWWHIGVTTAWVGFAVGLWISKSVGCLPANEIGDFLAGMASPAAFYWLVVAYFLQTKELRLQRHELALQREEAMHHRAETARIADTAQQTAKDNRKRTRLEENAERHTSLRAEAQNIPNTVKFWRDKMTRLGQLKVENLPVIQIIFDKGMSDADWVEQVSAQFTEWDKRHLGRYGPLSDCLSRSNWELDLAFGVDALRFLLWYDKQVRLDNLLGSRIFRDPSAIHRLDMLREALQIIVDTEYVQQILRISKPGAAPGES